MKTKQEEQQSEKELNGQHQKVEQQQSVSARPSRRAKTKEAVQKHLNRDVELLAEEKPEKKASAKRAAGAQGSTAALQVCITGSATGPGNAAGKRSLSRSGTSMGKNSIPKAQTANTNTSHFNTMQVPPSILDSGGSSSLGNQNPIAPFISSLMPKTLIDQNDEEKNKSANKKTEKKKGGEVDPAKTRSTAVKGSGKIHDKEIEISKEGNQGAGVDVDFKEDDESVSLIEDEEMTETDGNEDMADEELDEDEDEDLPDSEEAEEEASDSSHDLGALSLDMRRKRKLALKKEAGLAAAANRALRIKMGKSGAQAASRKSIKSGKDACQRKLWNQDEDDAIVSLVQKYGTKRWTYIAQMLKDDYHIGGRTGKQCRERWHNHLDPSIKKSPINGEEEIIIFDAHKVYGNKWADIAKLLQGRSDNCIKNYYYSTLRKHIRRINKSLKQCQVAKVLNLKVRTLTADILFPLVKDSKISYAQVKNIDHKKFEDLEHTMRMIFNHEDGQQVTQRGIIAAAQNRVKVEKQLEEMRERERQEERDNDRKRDKEGKSTLGKRTLTARATEKKATEVKKRQKQLGNDETESEELNQESSQDNVNMASDDEDTQPKMTQTDGHNSQITSQNQNDTKEQLSLRKNSGHGKMPVLKPKLLPIGGPIGDRRQDAPHQGASQSLNAGNSSLKAQNSISFPKGLQLKPPISKGRNQKSSRETDGYVQPLNQLQNSKLGGSGSAGGIHQNEGGLASGNAPTSELLALGGNLTSGSGQQSSVEAHNVFKNQMADKLHQKVRKMGVTENEDAVTKTNFGNRSNCSENEQPLQQQERDSQRIRDKKHKKKKKNKRNNEGSKKFGQQASLFSGLTGMPAANVDEIAAQFDYLQSSVSTRIPSHNLADMLALTSQKNSASKIYPGFYDHMHHPKARKDQSMGYSGSGSGPGGSAGAAAGVGAHTCNYSGAGGHLSHFPPYMFSTPYYMSQFYPFHPMSSAGPMFHPESMKFSKGQAPEKQKHSKSSNRDTDQKHKSKQEQSGDRRNEGNKDEEAGSSENKGKKDEQKEKHLENENHFMGHEAMNHYFALSAGQMHPGPMSLPPHLQAHYQKNGHLPPHLLSTHGMPFYPFAASMPIPPPQYQPRERQTHHSSAYHKQFTMPITPHNLQHQVFGAEKQLYMADSTGGASQQQRQLKRTQGHSATPEEASEEKEKKEQGEKKLLTTKLGLTKRSSSANNLQSQSQSMLQQPTQFNSNITLMINHFGPAPNQAAPTQQNEDSKGLKKAKERSDLKDKIHGSLSPLKQISGQKHEQKSRPAANSSVSFKQSFKPQRIDMFQKRFQEARNSRGVTPNNQGPHPLISASNLLLGQNMFGAAASGAGVYHFPGFQPSQSASMANKKENQTLQSRLFAGTPRLFLGQNLSHLQQKIPTSTTAAAAAAFASQQDYQGGGLLLTSQRNLNSGHTFNASGAFGGGSRMNTKTHAQQLASGKGGNTLITPKVNTVGNDPETHRKLLEKMFHNTNNQERYEAAPVNLMSTNGGAFTKKQGATGGGASASREGSHRASSQNNLLQSQSKQSKKGDQHSGDSSKQEPIEPRKEDQKPQLAYHPERDSIGLFYVNPSQLILNQDPLASIYTGAPGGPAAEGSPLQTPLLGARQGAGAATSTERREQESDEKADSILDQSEAASQRAEDDEDVEMLQE